MKFSESSWKVHRKQKFSVSLRLQKKRVGGFLEDCSSFVEIY
jgi:hypothetical protein